MIFHQTLVNPLVPKSASINFEMLEIYVPIMSIEATFTLPLEDIFQLSLICNAKLMSVKALEEEATTSLHRVRPLV